MIAISLCWRVGVTAAAVLTTLTAPLVAQNSPPGVGGNPPAGSPPVGLSTPAVDPQMPRGFPLPRDHQEYVEMLLDAWERSSGQVKRCVVAYQRTEYNPQLCQWRDPQSNQIAGCSVHRGEIRFQAPDKASFETDRAWDFAGPPAAEGQSPEYKEREDATLVKEKWICDGQMTYEFNFAAKRLTERTIPAEYQGDGLINSPLPFLFGAKRQQLLERFWIKVITPRGVEDEYWLEVYPKKQADAQRYQKVQVIITQRDFLPRSIVIFAPEYDEVNNPVFQHFEFGNRRINDQLSAISSFLDIFIRPQTPGGWTRVNGDIPETGTASQMDPAQKTR